MDIYTYVNTIYTSFAYLYTIVKLLKLWNHKSQKVFLYPYNTIINVYLNSLSYTYIEIYIPNNIVKNYSWKYISKPNTYTQYTYMFLLSQTIFNLKTYTTRILEVCNCVCCILFYKRQFLCVQYKCVWKRNTLCAVHYCFCLRIYVDRKHDFSSTVLLCIHIILCYCYV